MPHAERVPGTQILQRICGEFLEMPGLRLTVPQARRLWGLDDRTCVDALKILQEQGFLQQTRDGRFTRSTDGPAAFAVLAQIKRPA
jgi:Fic family protein